MKYVLSFLSYMEPEIWKTLCSRSVAEVILETWSQDFCITIPFHKYFLSLYYGQSIELATRDSNMEKNCPLWLHEPSSGNEEVIKYGMLSSSRGLIQTFQCSGFFLKAQILSLVANTVNCFP